MKIAYVLGEYPSQSETFIAREIAALRRRGFEIDICALKAGEGARQIPNKFSSRLWAKVRGVQREYSLAQGKHWAKRERAHLQGVQHIHAGWASFPADIARGAAEELGLPWSFSGHARDLWVENSGLAEKVRDAKFAACCTREGAEFLKNLAPDAAKGVLYAPHGIEISKYDFQKRREKHEPIRILAVGRLVEKKGFNKLLTACASLVNRKFSIGLLIIGDGPNRASLEMQCEYLPFDVDQTFAGQKTHQYVATAMQESDIFVMPSNLARDGDRDGLPNVLLEAAACGLPIVTTRAGSIEDFLDESCAWLCAPADANALADTIQNAVENYDDSLRRAKVARARVETNFDIEKNIEVLISAFTSS